MELKELIKKIEQWAIDRELDKKATVEAQSIKTAEEMAELIIGISKDNLEVIKDSIGDVFVTLVIGNMIDEKHDMEEVYKTALSHFDDYKACFKANKYYLIAFLNSRSIEILDYKYYIYNLMMTIKELKCTAEFYDLEFTDCIESAYNEIKDRKGKTVNGQFIKEEDLN